jgi:hypothetical protein
MLYSDVRLLSSSFVLGLTTRHSWNFSYFIDNVEELFNQLQVE